MHTHDDTRPQPPSVRGKAAEGAESMQAPEQASAPLPAPENPTYYNMWDTNEVTPQDNNISNLPVTFRFDWYQATLNPEVEPVQVLRWASFFGESKPMKGMHGYDRAHDFGQFKIMYGGHSGKYGVHIIIHGGDACQDVVDAFKGAFPDHRPSRIDVCADFRSSDAWDKLSALGQKSARKHDIMMTTQGDWLDGKRGRTLYIGGKSGVFRARIYEKGHEMRSKGKSPDAPLDWVRVEFQIKPPRHTRHTASTLTPDQLARSGRWPRFIFDNLKTTRVPTVRLNTRRKTPEPVESFEYMAAQYCRVIAEIKRDQWMDKEQFQRIMSDIWEKGDFNGLPADVYRSYYF